MIIYAVLVVVFSYLIGSVNFAVIFSKVFMKKDVREIGSGNAGTTNIMRNGGFVPGALTFLCDALKGFVASFAGKMVFDYILGNTDAAWALPIYGAYICGLACMLGHVFPVFFQFKGGKGVATSVGIFAVCSPVAIVLGLTVFAIVTLTSKYVSVASIVATVTVVTCSLIFRVSDAPITPEIIMSVAMGLIVILKHIENIKRIIAGTESKIGDKKNG